MFGCLLGNLLCICAATASQEQVPPAVAPTHLNLAAILQPLAITFHPMDLLFDGIALYEGYRLSSRRVTQADIARVAAVRQIQTGV